MTQIILQDLLGVIKYILIYRIMVGAVMVPDKRRKLVCVIGAAVFIVCHGLFWPTLSVSVLNVVFFILSLFLYKGYFKNKIFIAVLVWIGAQLWDTVLLSLFSFSRGQDPFLIFTNQNVSINIGVLVITVVFLFLIWIFVRKETRQNWLIVRGEMWQFFCLCLTGFSILTLAGMSLIYFFYGIRPELRVRFYLAFVIVIFCFLVPVFILVFYYRDLKHQAVLQQTMVEAYRRQNELQLKYYEDMREKDEELRYFRHDYRHHMQTLSVLLKEERLEEARAYLEEIKELGIRHGAEQDSYTGNKIVDASIFGVLCREEYRGIAFHCKGHLPEELGIESVDLCRLVSNAMENAARACVCAGEPQIDLEVRVFRHMVYFTFQNTYSGTVLSEQLQARKHGDGNGHGFGIYNMQQVAEKYDGNIGYRVTDTYVTLDVEVSATDTQI